MQKLPILSMITASSCLSVLLVLINELRSVDGFAPSMESSRVSNRNLSSIHIHPLRNQAKGNPIFKLALASASTTESAKLKPAMIVFDLDNTLWTPELYQLRTLQTRQRKRQQGKNQDNPIVPIAGKDVQLFEGIQTVIESIRESSDEWEGTKFAVASRTKSVAWAEDLIKQFGLDDFFQYMEIFPGDKRKHFRNLHESSGISYDQMLFFDDNRDGKYGNCVPVSEMGVLSVHCPGGINTEEVFNMGLKQFLEWDGKANTIVEWDGSVSRATQEIIDTEKRQRGTVKFVNEEKRFGFIKLSDKNDVFFPYRNLPGSYQPNRGDKLSFVMAKDPRDNKNFIADSIEVAESFGNNTTISENSVKLRAFSMNLPFAALLANQYKTLETRNGTMFTTYPEGTKMLLHVGQRTYPDGNRHLDIMRGGGLSDEEIFKLKSLPKGFSKGMVVAIVEIGKTYETTLEERCDEEFQRNVGAFGRDSGKMVTEIKRVEYLKQGVKVSGRGGVFKVDIDEKKLPEGWM